MDLKNHKQAHTLNAVICYSNLRFCLLVKQQESHSNLMEEWAKVSITEYAF